MKRTPSVLIRDQTLAVLAVLCLALPAVLVEAQVHQSLQALVRELGVAASARQLLFVEAAVAELKAAYRTATRAAAGHMSWADGAQAFSASFEVAVARARAGERIRLLQEPDGVIRVVVGIGPARQFMISAPTAGGGSDLERAIVQHFCRLDGCGGPVNAEPPSALLTAVAAHSGLLRPSTVVAELPAGDDGLHCATSNAPHHRLYANACQALVGEMRALAHALHGAARRGIAIEWPSLRRSIAAGVLVLKARGERVELALPALAQAPEVGAELVPWLRDRLAGKVRLLAFAPSSRLVYATR